MRDGDGLEARVVAAAIIDCNLAGFTTRANGVRPVPVAIADLVKAAAVVGMPLIAGRSRPWLEVQWRTSMVKANVGLTADGSHWTRTDSYDRLDPSEKNAVSYFLGMVQAAVVSDLVLGYPHLVHVDELLTLQGDLLKGQRPDFVAVDPIGVTPYAATVEAKGRTNNFSQSARQGEASGGADPFGEGPRPA